MLHRLLLTTLLLTLLAACQDDYLVPPGTGVAPPGTAAPGTAAPEPPEPEPPAPEPPSPEPTPFDPPPGSVTWLERSDSGCDGGAEQCVWTTYDAAGQLLHQERRMGCDTASPSCELLWIDAEGARVTATDDRCDGRLSGCLRVLDTDQLNVEERDEDCVGEVDSRTVWELNERRETIAWRTEQHPGTAEASCNAKVYNPDPEAQLQDGEDRGCDGVLDTCTVRLRDASGRAVGAAYDEGCDGAYEACSINTPGGQDSILATPEGAGCQGAALTCRLREQRVELDGRWSFVGEDPACDGHPVQCWRFFYDAGGELTSYWRDDDCDGVGDRECKEESTTLDGDVSTTHSIHDEDCDGVPDSCGLSVKDDSDHEDPRYLLTEVDAGCDGELDFCQRTTRDAQGQVLEEWYGCGEPERNCSSWRYDAAGHTIYEAHSERCDPNPDGCTTWRYDAAGNLTYEGRDEGCDGSMDQCSVSTWSPDGLRLSLIEDYDCDGTPEHCTETIPFP